MAYISYIVNEGAIVIYGWLGGGLLVSRPAVHYPNYVRIVP